MVNVVPPTTVMFVLSTGASVEAGVVQLLAPV